MLVLWNARLEENARSAAAAKRVARDGNPNPAATQASAAPPSTPPTLGRTTWCKFTGCGNAASRAGGWCERDRWRLRRLGMDAETTTGEEAAAAWVTRDGRNDAAEERRFSDVARHPDADEPLQRIRVALGCDPDGADEEVVEAAQALLVKAERAANRLERLRSNLREVLEVATVADDLADDVRLVDGLQEQRRLVAIIQVRQAELAATNDRLEGDLRRHKNHLDDIRCDILDRGHPLGDDSDPEMTPRRDFVIERLGPFGTHPVLRVCRSHLDSASGCVIVRLEQDASGELPPIPMGALVALVPQPERF